MRYSPLVLLLLLGCTSPTSPDAVLGTWGGTEASMVLTVTGGTLSYMCGDGTIDSNWTLAPGGRFLATGAHYFGGGPVPPGGNIAYPARYAGQVQGDALTLTVTLPELGDTLGPFHLVRGGPTVVQRCV